MYPVHIPIALDNPYIVEQYTSWVLLEALAVHGILFSLCRQRKSGLYHDCKSNIEAVSANTSPHCPLVCALLDRCEILLPNQGLAKPDHLYSRHTGTFLDEILDMVDEKAKLVATQQHQSLGSIANLQPPQVCFLVGGVQRQDPTAYIAKQVHICYVEQFEAPPPPRDIGHLQIHESTVMTGMINWAAHLRTVWHVGKPSGAHPLNSVPFAHPLIQGTIF